MTSTEKLMVIVHISFLALDNVYDKTSNNLVSQAIAASVLISITGEVQVKPGQRLICDHSNQLSRKILATAMRV